MLWMAILGAILVWTSVPAAESTSSDRQGYQINPKPCWVDGQEGTCMFVYECIKSEGYHIGMCVDAFMFGSCCAYNVTSNALGAASKPQVLYTTPTLHQPTTRKPIKITSMGFYSSSHLRPTRPSSHATTEAGTSKQHSISVSLNVRPGSSSRQPTQPPRHSLRPMSTDAFSHSNSILAPYTKPEKQPSTEKSGWQFTTEPGFVTRLKKPSSFKPKPYKPTKKPLPTHSKFPSKPTKPTTERQ
ncbi:hypothetical protein HUJ05_002484 [Dendroctonus ponderosae]|nr:hypothetical protein HUJ05_002484 [Dendroctonus ponderosae]